MIDIPGAAIEAAAKAEYETNIYGNRWEDLHAGNTIMRLKTAGIGLAAALPHLESAIRADERERLAKLTDEKHALEPDSYGWCWGDFSDWLRGEDPAPQEVTND